MKEREEEEETRRDLEAAFSFAGDDCAGEGMDNETEIMFKFDTV